MRKFGGAAKASKACMNQRGGNSQMLDNEYELSTGRASRSVARPLVSIIINSYNYSQYLVQSIESALAQSYPNVEVIVVDDASTDGSREVIVGYDDRVKAILQNQNGGQGSACNAGFAMSRGEIVMFLDSDDWLYPHAVDRVVAAWRTGLSRIHFRLDLVNTDGQVLDMYPAREMRMDDGDVVPLLLATGRYVTTVTTGNAFARRALEAVMPMPEQIYRICADGYLVTVVPFHGPIAKIEERLGAYRKHNASLYAFGNPTEDMDAFLRRLHKGISHDMDKYQSLREEAARVGQVASDNLGRRDPLHLETRLASLRLDRASHPFPNDVALGLAFDGWLSLHHTGLSRSRQAVLAVWFLAVSMLPKRWATHAITWRFAQSSRSPTVQRWLKRIRSLTD